MAGNFIGVHGADVASPPARTGLPNGPGLPAAVLDAPDMPHVPEDTIIMKMLKAIRKVKISN
jgi:hypothetical protein